MTDRVSIEHGEAFLPRRLARILNPLSVKFSPEKRFSYRRLLDSLDHSAQNSIPVSAQPAKAVCAIGASTISTKLSLPPLTTTPRYDVGNKCLSAACSATVAFEWCLSISLPPTRAHHALSITAQHTGLITHGYHTNVLEPRHGMAASTTSRTKNSPYHVIV
jgi:hypothetical protein